MKKISLKKGNLRNLLLMIILPVLTLAALVISQATFAGDRERKSRTQAVSPLTDPNIPAHIDMRLDALSKVSAIQLRDAQRKSIVALENKLGGEQNLKVIYNGLTATPSRVYNPQGYLTAPSSELPEAIALGFIRHNSEMFRFTEDDLNSLTLRSRATTAEGTTIMLFQQQIGDIPVYQGEVMVNVNRNGQIINVGGMNYPQIALSGDFAISAAQAVANAAQTMNIAYYSQSLGKTKIRANYGNLQPAFADGEKFSGGDVFSDDISVQKVIFPLGAEGRPAYKFVLTTPQYYGIMWQNIVDAQTGEVLQRLSLTSFQNERGGGLNNNRLGTFRPDVQNMVESYYQANGANGKVFDTYPSILSGVGGVGRATRTGTPGSYIFSKPTYQAETLDTNRFRYSMVNAHNEGPFFFNATGTQTFTEAQFPGILGQILRGLPSATNPSASSPFGWFYLPTGTGGVEITTGDSNRGATRIAGYTMSSEAQTRNLAVNSPNGNGLQPFSADLTALGSSVTLNDGRVLSSVFQSRYTEGNNVTVSDDRQNDNDSTKGIKGYSTTRQFNDPRFSYFSSYELGGTDASGGGTGSTTPVTYPATANADVYPGTVSLFYFNNVEHDYLYSIGFTEAFWNFQFDNFGKGGAGGDAIVAEVQDGSGTDNANMGTPDDGGSPRMQMYLFTDGGFRRSDGDFDWDVIAHEHYHGVSNRSAGKGSTSCLGTPLVGESGGMGEGWSDFIASSMSDDDNEGEHVTGDQDRGIRSLPYTNYRYSYGATNDQTMNVRKNANTDVIAPETNPGGIPFEVHDVGELWAATLWDMRELLIVKQKVGNTYPGIFFDGTRRMGGGSGFYIGNRLVQSVDTNHPINYRQSFLTDASGTPGLRVSPRLNSTDIVRPGMLATENQSYPRRNGPLATAVSNGARLADKIVLRGLQLAPCNPTFIDMRDSMIMADREITGGENVSIIWRAFTSHGVGMNATSSNSGTGGAGPAVEDFTTPANVSACELNGPLPAPNFTLSNSTSNTVSVAITQVSGATDYVIQRANSAAGPYATIATVTGTSYSDTSGISLGNTYYYQIHARRNTECVGTANVQSVTITVGTAPIISPVFFGLDSVSDPKSGSSLVLNWSSAVSLNPNAAIVYDIYRVNNVALDNDLTAPTFTPSTSNRIAQGVTATTYINTGLTLGQQYYYIVRARDTNNNQTDTNNVGNTRTRFNAPTTTLVSSTPFALEDFSQTSANNRFTPALTDSTTADNSTAMYQRIPAAASLTNSNVMFAPDFDPGNAGQGGPSNFASLIGPLTLTRTSILEFDHQFSTESGFDGNNLEIVLGAPTVSPADATPFPNNSTTYDLNDYLIQNGYSGALDASLEGAAIGSPLQGRRSFTGTGSLAHVRAALGDFAPGAIRNPNSLPVYVRFHTSSDAGSNAGAGSGWYVDNLAVNNYAPVPLVSISGTITKSGSPLSGVTVTLSGSASATMTTNASGQFTFVNLPQGGNYLVTPTLAGNTFEPNYRSYTNVNSNVANADFVAYDSNNVPRNLAVGNVFVKPGQSVTVPITLTSLGNEEGFGFSLSYDTSKLSNPQVACGSDAPGCVITTNTGTSGAIGIVIDNVTFTAGTKQLVTVTFSTTANPPNTAPNTPVTFRDSPTPRSTTNGNGDLLSSSYTDGLVVFIQNYECDVAGRFAGDGDVLSNDLIIMRQFAARNITANAQYNEFQRADCAPRTTNGDAQILSNDLLQARRYSARNDALQLADGPTEASGSLAASMMEMSKSNAFVPAAAPVVSIVSQTGVSRISGTTVTVPIQMNVTSDVQAFSLSIKFNQNILTYQSAVVGTTIPGATLTLNTSQTATGNLGIVIDSGTPFPQGNDQVVRVTFTVASNVPNSTTSTPITFVGTPTPFSTSDSQGNLVTTTYDQTGTVSFAGATAGNSSVGGRVVSQDGRAINKAAVQIVDSNGKTRTVYTSSFGYYRFDEVTSGETYTLRVSAKQYSFAPRTLTVSDSLSDVDFVGESKQPRR